MCISPLSLLSPNFPPSPLPLPLYLPSPNQLHLCTRRSKSQVIYWWSPYISSLLLFYLFSFPPLPPPLSFQLMNTISTYTLHRQIDYLLWQCLLLTLLHTHAWECNDMHFLNYSPWWVKISLMNHLNSREFDFLLKLAGGLHSLPSRANGLCDELACTYVGYDVTHCMY